MFNSPSISFMARIKSAGSLKLMNPNPLLLPVRLSLITLARTNDGYLLKVRVNNSSLTSLPKSPQNIRKSSSPQSDSEWSSHTCPPAVRIVCKDYLLYWYPDNDLQIIQSLTFLSFFLFSLIWKFCNADEAFAAWIAASAMGFGPLFSAFNFLSFCVTSNWIDEISICWVGFMWCISAWVCGIVTVGRFVYNFGALLRTTGVGSEL